MAEAREAFRWVAGIHRGDGAGLGAAWATLTATCGLIARGFVDGQEVAHRIRAEALKYDIHAQPEPVRVVTHETTMAGPNAKAAAFLSRGQRAEIQRVVREELASGPRTRQGGNP